MKYTIKITKTNTQFDVNVDQQATTDDIISQVAEHLKVDQSAIKLVWNQRMITKAKSIPCSEIKDNSTIFAIVKESEKPVEIAPQMKVDEKKDEVKNAEKDKMETSNVINQKQLEKQQPPKYQVVDEEPLPKQYRETLQVHQTAVAYSSSEKFCHNGGVDDQKERNQVIEDVEAVCIDPQAFSEQMKRPVVRKHMFAEFVEFEAKIKLEEVRENVIFKVFTDLVSDKSYEQISSFLLSNSEYPAMFKDLFQTKEVREMLIKVKGQRFADYALSHVELFRAAAVAYTKISVSEQQGKKKDKPSHYNALRELYENIFDQQKFYQIARRQDIRQNIFMFAGLRQFSGTSDAELEQLRQFLINTPHPEFVQYVNREKNSAKQGQDNPQFDRLSYLQKMGFARNLQELFWVIYDSNAFKNLMQQERIRWVFQNSGQDQFLKMGIEEVRQSLLNNPAPGFEYYLYAKKPQHAPLKNSDPVLFAAVAELTKCVNDKLQFRQKAKQESIRTVMFAAYGNIAPFQGTSDEDIEKWRQYMISHPHPDILVEEMLAVAHIPTQEEIENAMRILYPVINDPDAFLQKLKDPIVEQLMENAFSEMQETPEMFRMYLIEHPISGFEQYVRNSNLQNNFMNQQNQNSQTDIQKNSNKLNLKEKWKVQLEQIKQMGVDASDEEILELLEALNGNVSAVLDELLK